MDLRDRLTSVGAELLVRTLDRGLGVPTPQPEEGVTYAEKIRSEDRMLSAEMTSEQFMRVVRIGGAWTEFRGKRLKIAAARRPAPSEDGSGRATEVGEPAALAPDSSQSVETEPVEAPGVFVRGTAIRTVDGLVELLFVQPEGKAAMSAADWAHGAHPSGDRIDT